MDTATKTFKEIVAWQKAFDYCLFVYEIADQFPDYEKYGLWSQFTRAAVSISANIAEGYRKLSKADKLRFLNIAQGSLDECRTYNLLSLKLKYITEEKYNKLEYMADGTEFFLNAYSKGIKDNNYEK